MHKIAYYKSKNLLKYDVKVKKVFRICPQNDISLGKKLNKKFSSNRKAVKLKLFLE